MNANELRIGRLEAGEALIAETVCLAFWRMAKGRENDTVTVASTDELRDVVDGIGIAGVTKTDVSHALNKIRVSSWAECVQQQDRRSGSGGKWRVTATTRQRAKHAADRLQTCLIPPPIPAPTAGAETTTPAAMKPIDKTSPLGREVNIPDTTVPEISRVKAHALIDGLTDLLGLAELGLSAQEENHALKARIAELERSNERRSALYDSAESAARILDIIAKAAESDTSVGQIIRALGSDVKPLKHGSADYVGKIGTDLLAALLED